jgi:ribosomal protein S18 acetylase RimI-like enzyme
MGATRAHFAKPVKCGEQRIAPLGARFVARSEIEDDRDWAVVDELDLHLRAEDARLDADAEIAQRLRNALDERIGVLGRRRGREARSVALAGLSEERELADDERFAVGIEERAVEAARLVGEDPQTGELRGETVGRRVVVPDGRTDEHEKPCPARADDLAVDADDRTGHTLSDGTHGAILYARNVAVVELRDRDELAAFLRRRPAVHAYALGDLDDFFWPHTRWLGLDVGGRLAQVALVYDEPDPPVLLALAEEPEDTMARLLGDAAERLPERLYAHLTPSLVETIAPVLVPVTEPARHRKLGLDRPDALEAYDTEDAESLGPADLDEVERFYARAYPGTWFQARMLETGRYVGVRRDDELVCVAGVHVWSPTWRVAALGNVATLTEARGNGLATAACARLCRILLDDGIDTISLNVRADNYAAIRAYEKLGFAHAADYVEVVLQRP